MRYSINEAVSIVFDTTSMITGLSGLWSGGCMELQGRKHIGELIVGSGFNALQIETSKSPDIFMHKSFQRYFSQVFSIS